MSITPKDIIRHTILRSKRSSAIVKVESPIDDEVRDLDEVINLYSKYPFIPFFEGADATLRFYAKMRKLSPTHSAIIESLITFVLGGLLTVVKRKDEGFSDFDNDDEEVTREQWDAYIEFIQSWISGKDLLNKMKKAYDGYKTWGNAFLEVVLTQVAGEKFAKLYVHDADRCRYMITLPNEDRLIGVAPIWTDYHLQKNPPRILPVYPNLGEFEDGTIRTIIHLKNPTIEREWYGEPDSVGCVFFQYLEYQLGAYTVEGYGNRWIAKIFFETFGDDEDNITNSNFDKALMDTFTQSGNNRKSVMHRNAPEDAKETRVHEFKPNTDEKFHQAMASIAENQILKVHNWNSLLLGVKISGSLGNGTEFRQVFNRKWYTKIKPEQSIILAPFRQAIGLVEEYLGYENSDELTIGLGNLFKDMLQEVSEAVQESENDNDGANVGENEENPEEA